MKVKNYILYGVIVLVMVAIFLLIVMSNADEPLDKYEKHDLKTEKHVSLNGGQSHEKHLQ